MVQLTPPPANVQDREVYNYLYQLQEYLQTVLDRASGGSGTAAQATQSASGGGRTSEQDILDRMQQIRALILKTADEVRSEVNVTLGDLEAWTGIHEYDGTESSLLALIASIESVTEVLSDYGTFVTWITQSFHASTEYTEQTIFYDEWLKSDAGSYYLNTNGYIRSGIVDYNGTVPIIGIAVGQDLDVEYVDATVNGESGTYARINKSGFRALFTAEKLSFWQGENELAYISNEQLYIHSANVLEVLTVGNWEIRDSDTAGMVWKWVGA